MRTRRYTGPGQEDTAEDRSPLEAAMVERFRNRIRLFAARRMRDWAAADDIAQETLRRAIEALRAGRINNPEALPGFLFQTAIHVCQHRSRLAGREGRALSRLGASDHQGPEDPLSSLISEERRLEVRRAYERLDPGDREVLSLTYEDDLTTAEIGRRLSLTEGNVRVRRHRAVRRLAELLRVTRDADRELKD